MLPVCCRFQPALTCRRVVAPVVDRRCCRAACHARTTDGAGHSSVRETMGRRGDVSGGVAAAMTAQATCTVRDVFVVLTSWAPWLRQA